MGLTLVVPVVLAALVRRARPGRSASIVGRLFAGVLLANEVLHWAHNIRELGFASFIQNGLPLQACSVAVLATAVALLWRNQWAYEIAYFWGLVGASNAVLTPSLEFDFPEYRFIQYFIAHGGIVAGALFATWSLRMRPDVRGLVRAFASLNAFALALALINPLLGSNYLYLSAPPVGSATPFFFAPWPWYIPILEVIALALFFLVLLPFLLIERRKRRA